MPRGVRRLTVTQEHIDEAYKDVINLNPIKIALAERGIKTAKVACAFGSGQHSITLDGYKDGWIVNPYKCDNELSNWLIRYYRHTKKVTPITIKFTRGIRKGRQACIV